MDVLARRVAVPDLHHRARHRRAVLVDDSRLQVDELANGALRAVARQIAAHRSKPPQHVLRPGELGGRQRPLLQRLRRPARGGLRIAGLDTLRLGQRISPVDLNFHKDLCNKKENAGKQRPLTAYS